MSHHFLPLIGLKSLVLALYIRDLFLELHICHTHFHLNQEYMNIPLMAVLKNHRHYLFDNFVSLLKVNLGHRERAMELESNLYEYFQKLTINNAQFKEKVRATLTAQDAIDILHCYFEEPFMYTRRCSLTIEPFLALDDLIHKEEETRKRKGLEAFTE